MPRHRFWAIVAATTVLLSMWPAIALAAPSLSVTTTGTDFLAGNNGNGLWRITVANSGTEDVAGPVVATVTVPSPQVLDTAVSSLSWTCEGAGTATMTCTLDSGVPVGVTVPTLQVPVILPGGVAGTATVDVTVTAASGAVSATSSGSAPIRPPYEPENPPVIPAAGVDLSVDAPFTKVLAGRTSTQEIIVRNTGVTASTGPTTVRASLTGAAITAGNGAGWKLSLIHI